MAPPDLMLPASSLATSCVHVSVSFKPIFYMPSKYTYKIAAYSWPHHHLTHTPIQYPIHTLKTWLVVSEACRNDLALGCVMRMGFRACSSRKGLALWRGQCHASLRARVPPLHPRHRLGVAPPNKKAAHSKKCESRSTQRRLYHAISRQSE